ncbi:hypothetical protein RJ641_023607 [Dillenia turbinata]|uniref:DNA excision repair protein ERCC-1 n=1 Tax=Dillenia turbinata TaxID=194707 RepID=A0AAN8UCP1_9MAGN
MAGEEEDDEQIPQHSRKRKNAVVIRIPSYQEVIESTQSRTQPPSLFTPSQSFSQAFSFIKSSEFYSPPPPPPPTISTTTTAATTSTSDQVSQLNDVDLAQRQIAQASASVASTSMSTPLSSHYCQSRNAILVSHRQKGNPLLKHIRNVRWNLVDIVCDYLLGQNSCALYLSLRYHLLHPDYLYYRIRELQKNFKLRVVLCHVDVEDVVKPLLEVTRTALFHDCTLLCGWSLEECGRYLETIKVYENKPADIIQGQMDTDYMYLLNHALTAVRRVNKTDVVTLGSTFGSLANIMDASMEDLARCPGIGERKVKRLYDTFHDPFKRVTNHSAALEIPVKDNTELSSINEDSTDDKEVGDANKGKKVEPELTVKSALAAAFAKYSGKVGRKIHEPKLDEGEGTSASVKTKAENRTSGEANDASESYFGEKKRWKIQRKCGNQSSQQ